MALYSYWRSSAAWRVRIALAWHGVSYEYRAVDLVAGAQRSASYVAEVHPGGLVPALMVAPPGSGNAMVLTQSLAIIDYIEERWCSGENMRLVPRGSPGERARVLEVALSIACDTHPMQNLRVLQRISSVDDRKKHAAEVITAGLAAVERLLERSRSSMDSGPFALGSRVTLADVVLVPQVYNARRWGVDVDALFPLIASSVSAAEALPAFAAAHPDSQPDAGRNAS